MADPLTNGPDPIHIDRVPTFQLLQWKYAIKLEALGLRHSKGSVHAHAKRVLGIRGGKERVIAYIDSILERRQ